MKKEVSLFLDSGAHSFYMKSKLKNENFSDKEFNEYFISYMDFIKKNKDYIDVYVNLDVINDPEWSYKNYLIMKKNGLDPIPVVHPGEDPKWMKKYLDLNCSYVGTGGLGQFFTKGKYIDWVSRVWCDVLTDKQGFPVAKVHGFAVTSLEVMLMFPWFSVDSTSWVMTSRFGSVYVPRKNKGKYDYTLNPWKVAVSAKSPSQEDAGQHITTFALMDRREIEEYFKFKGFKLGKSETQQVGKDYKLKAGERWFGKEEADTQRIMYGDRRGYVKTGWEKDLMIEFVIESGLSNDYKQRDELNIIYFLDLEKNFPKWPWSFKKKKSIEGFGLSY